MLLLMILQEQSDNLLVREIMEVITGLIWMIQYSNLKDLYFTIHNNTFN